MTWQFYGGTLDAGKLTRENIVFFFCMDPKKFLTMMDGIDEFTPDQIEQLKKVAEEMVKDKRKVVIGVDRLKALQQEGRRTRHASTASTTRTSTSTSRSSAPCRRAATARAPS